MGMYAEIWSSPLNLVEEDFEEVEVGGVSDNIKFLKLRNMFWTNVNWHPFHYSVVEFLQSKAPEGVAIQHKDVTFVKLTKDELIDIYAHHLKTNRGDQQPIKLNKKSGQLELMNNWDMSEARLIRAIYTAAHSGFGENVYYRCI